MGKEKVIILGGAGFLGKSFAQMLPSNYEGVIVDIRPDFFDCPTGSTYIQTGDIENELLLSHLKEASYVIDFAYNSNPNNSFDDPVYHVANNLTRNIRLFELVGRFRNIKKLVVLSSGGTVYGRSDLPKIPEHSQTNPISPYGINKLTIEKYALMHHELYGIPAVIARPSNPYGPGQRPYQGQGFISTAISRILNNESITVFGEQGRIRDYIYIDDFTSGVFDVMINGKAGDIYNIGSGIGLSNLEILNALSGIMKMEFKISIEPERSFDVPRNILDTSKLQNETGWNCKTDLNSGLQNSIQWVSNYIKETAEA